MRVRDLFYYDEETGDLTNKFTGAAPHVNGQGYKVVFVGKKRVNMHRLVWLYHNENDDISSAMIDHINGDKLDNRIENLRTCSNSQNQMNRGRQKNNTTGFKGVFKNGNKFIARIRHNGVLLNLGTFEKAEDAFDRYVEKARELQGEFCYY